ncbi:MAG: TonB-dependent receptor [Pseudomonadota bacterium]
MLLLATTAAVASDELLEFDIKAQPLAGALEAFADQAQRQVSSDAQAISGFSSNSVTGRMTAIDALSRLVSGTGLDVVQNNGGDFVIRSGTSNERPAGDVTVAQNNDVWTEEVFVLGERLDKSLQDTQSSVAVYSGDELDADVGQDLFDLIERTAGVSVQGGGFGFNVRGIPGGGIAGGSGPTLEVSVDGASLPPGQSVYTGPVSTWDLGQVEVFRGPQSTQSGQNSLAGAIHLRSADPVFEREFKLRADAGSFNERRLAAAVNLPLSDIFAVRLSAEEFESDGDIESAFTGRELAGRSMDTYRVKFRLQPNDDLNIVLGYHNAENDFGQQQIDDATFPEQRIASTGNTTQVGENELLSLRVDYSLNDDWQLNFEAGYIENDYIIDIAPVPNDPAPFEGFRTILAETESYEVGATYTGERLRANFGVYYSERTQDLVFQGRFPAFLFLPVPPGTFAEIDQTIDGVIENNAVFGEVEFDINEKWMLVVGARYDVEESDQFATTATTFDPPVFVIPPPPGEFLNTDYQAFLPKVGIVYNWTDRMSTGFTVQRGYRAGGFESLPLGQNEFDPEFTTNYEFSFRSLWLEDRLVVNANVYFTDWTDQQVSVPGPSGTFLDSRTDNAGESKLYGFELETFLTLSPDTDFYFTASYAKTEFKEFISAPQFGAGDNVDLAGNEFPQAPRWTGSIGVNHRFANGFEFDIDGSYTDKTYYTQFNNLLQRSDSFVLVNAKVGYRAERWSAFVFARNLLDREYLSRVRLDGSSTAGDSQVVGLTVSANF